MISNLDGTEFYIISDSLSSLQALKNNYSLSRSVNAIQRGNLKQLREAMRRKIPYAEFKHILRATREVAILFQERRKSQLIAKTIMEPAIETTF